MRFSSVLVPLCLVASTSCLAEGVFLSLRHEAGVERTNVALGDIAQIVTRDAILAEQLGRIPVGRCANLIAGCQFEAASISRLVETRASELGASLVWGANGSVAVNGRLRMVSMEHAIDQGAARIVQALGQGGSVSVSVAEAQVSVEVPPGVVQIQAEPNRMRRVGAYFEMPVQVFVDGVLVAQPQVKYLASRSAARVDVPLVLGDSSVVPRTMGPSDGADVSPDIRKSVSASGKDVRRAVMKDQKVRLLIESGPVHIEADGVALGDADIGTDVKVRRANGLATVMGRTIDQDTVRILGN